MNCLQNIQPKAPAVRTSGSEASVSTAVMTAGLLPSLQLNTHIKGKAKKKCGEVGDGDIAVRKKALGFPLHYPLTDTAGMV